MEQEVLGDDEPNRKPSWRRRPASRASKGVQGVARAVDEHVVGRGTSRREAVPGKCGCTQCLCN